MSLPTLILWVHLILFCFLMLLSGFFSSSETSLFSLNQVQIEQMRRDSNPRIGLSKHLLSEPRLLIVTILIGNEFVNVAASVISAAAVIKLMGDEYKWVNLFVMVPILPLFGEITPKTLAIRNNVAFATFQCRLIDGFARAILLLRRVVREVPDVIITLIVGKERSRENVITEDMVRSLARKLIRTRHSKVPVYRDDLDTIAGVLFARDLLGVDLTNGSVPKTEELLRKACLVPETRAQCRTSCTHSVAAICRSP